jgi:hypothetical protein
MGTGRTQNVAVVQAAQSELSWAMAGPSAGVSGEGTTSIVELNDEAMRIRITRWVESQADGFVYSSFCGMPALARFNERRLMHLARIIHDLHSERRAAYGVEKR